MSKIVGISGNITQPSRTRSLVETILTRASHKLHASSELINIADLTAVLGTTVTFDNFPQPLHDAYQKLHAAELVVIATPVYKGSYSGLLKHYFDLVDPKQLKGKVAILAATGGSDQHALVLEYQLRSLASFFGLYTVPVTIYAKDSEFSNYQLNSEAIENRIDAALEQAAFLLAQHQPAALVA